MSTEICVDCGQPVGEDHDCVRRQREAMVRLLQQIGDPARCSGCHAPIVWVIHKNGKKAPYDWSGLNHFVSCVQAEKFRKKL
jgi:hypothetical protein